ncbi:MAG TPA: hypothetical protein VH414_17810 [Lichenihabitans sp.]|jgi:hypothetical protein|nr:hypothetical protein [Lichenihabitans sp.]
MRTGLGFGPATRAAVLAVAAGAMVAAGSVGALAQDGSIRHRGEPAHHLRTAGLRPLTVHRRAHRIARGPVVVDRSYERVPSLLRRWNDPNLDSFGGWRLGGDNFYGDGRGDPITRGNATLGQISGYGPARGGYGGPHFDSVGGFHNGPGPDAQEDADYASGSISQPDYGGIVPHYASVRQRVAALNTGIPKRVGATPVAYRAPASTPDDEPYARPDDIFPGFGLGDDIGF